MNSQSKLLAGLIFILSLVLSVVFFIYRDFFSQAQSLGLLGIFLINAISNASLFISAPSFLTIIAGGALYPPVFVGLVGSLGSAVGDMLSYVLGFSGRRLAHHKLSKKFWFKVLEDYFKLHGTWMLFLFSLIPNPVFDSVGIIAGIFAYPWWKVLLLVFIGRFIRFFFLAQFGSMF